LNLPVMYELSDRLWHATQARGIPIFVNIITNGLLLTPDVVDRLLPYGLNGIKITLDGDKDAHNRMRPLRGGQGTFDRIVDNIRKENKIETDEQFQAALLQARRDVGVVDADRGQLAEHLPCSGPQVDRP